MSVVYEIVPASIRHVRPLAATMRTASIAALEGRGFRPREALRRELIASHHCRTALIDGRPVAMWGINAPLLGDKAIVWLVLSDQIAEMPRAIVREARHELAIAARQYAEVVAPVLPDDEKSVRFARFLGFGGRPERKPMGDGYALQLTYDPHGPESAEAA